MEQTLISMDWQAMAPEWTVAAGAALLLLLDLLAKRSVSRAWIGALALLTVFVSGGFLLAQAGEPATQILEGSYRADSFALAFKALMLTGTALVILLSFVMGKEELENREGEYWYLLLFALLGGMMMASSTDLVTLFVGLELLSISSYILVGVRRKHPASTEAAWKYVVLGGVGSAFTLYGMSFLYGISGSTDLFTIQQMVPEALYNGSEGLVWLSLALMIVGFGFKISSVPFHMWTPDVYQGAATPVTVFLAVVSKAAAFALIIRVLLIGYLQLWMIREAFETVNWMLMILAAASMLVGSAAALRQTDAKRLLAYSSIAQAGFLLVPLVSVKQGIGTTLLPSLFFYLAVYVLMTAGAFAVTERVTAEAETGDIRAFAGLGRRRPWLAFIMSVLLLSLAGLPPAAGFLGKFYLMTGVIFAGEYWLAVVMVAATVASYYYYFAFIRQMYFRSSGPEEIKERRAWPAVVVGGICAIGVLILGLWPDLLLEPMNVIDWVQAITPVSSSVMEP
ncbi:NADH-quinone oxidoreductase subunit N [Staphylospora marina]|uniref:NADH-quinone oxidoreductase subunit N n=1 Tax=Staphylospora marina TaxID=2490858 RepID=UPI000F5BA270|nr:NADH-quinone oxidoreductase subunit N [Staphylospora marina]